MKKFTITAILMASAFYAQAQNGELPPTHFNGSTNICDNTSWKLVFQDDFNGDTLKSPWLTFTPLRYNDRPASDDWLSRRTNDANGDPLAIAQDDNVMVSNGTVKLKVIKEDATWQCATCGMIPISTEYTDAALTLPYTLPFNSGKFEARIKMPIFPYAHSTMWTWYGDSVGVDEIDMAEAFGMRPAINAFPETDFNLHAWNPGLIDGDTSLNPYHLPRDQSIGGRYPWQSWWYWVSGTGFRQYEFHTYTCEWNPNVISVFVDGQWLTNYWKYYKMGTYSTGIWPFRKSHSYKMGSGCVPTSGDWKTLEGYPWNESSLCNLRFTSSLDQGCSNCDSGSTLGQMEIDYVKIWERHPEYGWVALCDAGDIAINGPDKVCGSTPVTYTASNPSPNGYWEVSSNLSVVSGNNTSVSVVVNPSGTGSLGDEGVIKYFPTSQNCPETNSPVFVQKNIVAGIITAHDVVVSRTVNHSDQTFNYYMTAPFSESERKAMRFGAAIAVWDIDYGPNFSQHYHYVGPVVSTPPIPYTPNRLETVKWTLTVTNACGSATLHGTMSYIGLAVVFPVQPIHNQFYVSALIPNAEKYETEVNNLLMQTMIPEGSSDTVIQQLILEKEMEALEPYIVMDTVTSESHSEFAKGVSNFPSVSAQTIVSPNPVTNSVSLVLGSGYDTKAPVEITIINNVGRIVFQKKIPYPGNRIATIDATSMQEGIYFVNLKQKDKSEHLKIVKAGN